MYGTAAGLVFGKLFFPHEDPLSATLLAFGTYFVGFIGRPIGAAIFGHYGRSYWPQSDADRDASMHGVWNILDRVCADLCVNRHLGRDHLNDPAGDPRHRRWRRMGWLRADVNGMGAQAWPARPGG